MYIHPKYQTFTKRLLAGFIDGLVFLPLIFVTEIVAQTANASLIIAWTGINSLLQFLYIIIGHGKYGQTLGKKAMGLKVYALDESSLIGYKGAFLRESIWVLIELVSFVFFATTYQRSLVQNLNYTYVYDYLSYASFAWLVLEMVTMLFNDKRRALHDYLGGSVVVDTTKV